MIVNPGIKFNVRCVVHKRYNPERQGLKFSASCADCAMVYRLYVTAAQKRNLVPAMELAMQRRFEAWQIVKRRWLTEYVGNDKNEHVTNHEPSSEDLLAQTWETLSPISKQFDWDVEVEFQAMNTNTKTKKG